MKEPKFENATEGVELELKFETWEVADGGDGKEREKWDLMREGKGGLRDGEEVNEDLGMRLVATYTINRDGANNKPPTASPQPLKKEDIPF